MAEVRFDGGPVPFGLVTGIVFEDANGNGRDDPGEVGEVGETVNLLLTEVASADGSRPETLSFSTNDGPFRSPKLDPGTYELSVYPPDGERVTTSFPGQLTIAAGVTTTLYIGFAPVPGPTGT